MELKEYLRIIKKDKGVIVKTIILTLAFTIAFSYLQKTSYESSVSLFIIKDGTQSTDEFKYDGYYALQSGEIVADNLEKMLQSPQVVSEIYQTANIDSNFDKIKKYKKSFTAHKMSNQYVEVSFNSETRENAEKISKSITKTIQQKMEQAKSSSEDEVSFSIENNSPVIIKKEPDIALNSLVGIFSGFFLGMIIVLIKKYFA
jgi:capsular polysaccharide biosynthesis protein